MKLELIKLYKEYKEYVQSNFEYFRWENEFENDLPSFIEFLENGKLLIVELEDITLE